MLLQALSARHTEIKLNKRGQHHLEYFRCNFDSSTSWAAANDYSETEPEPIPSTVQHLQGGPGLTVLSPLSLLAALLTMFSPQISSINLSYSGVSFSLVCKNTEPVQPPFLQCISRKMLHR